MPDTIAAISTASGISAIGIVRLSGDLAIDIARRVFRPKSGADLSGSSGHKLHYGELTGADGSVIDICMCTVMRAPDSYTGENMAELHCHGSPVVLRQAILSLFKAGARQALPGEFTRRAFLNGKLDLSQAEAVIDLIEAETGAAARNAAAQVSGAIRRRMEEVYSALLDILAHFHAAVDYPDEDIGAFERREYTAALREAEASLDRLVRTYERGAVLRGGIPAAIIGRPNTGKSSLLNAMLGYERAIVTDIPGTTRDTIEGKVALGDVLLRLVDTAGIRETDDTVERMGVQRARAAADGAALALAVFDGSEALGDEDRVVIEAAAAAKKAIAIINKCDLAPLIERAAVERALGACEIVSAKTGAGLDALERRIRDMFEDGEEECAAGEVLTNARQADAVRRAAEAARRAGEAMALGVTPDAALSDIEDALRALGEVTGGTVSEDVTARIFERFCVGK